MVDQLSLFWPSLMQPGQSGGNAAARVELPPWMTGGETKKQQRHAYAGRHPTGRGLGPSARTCDDCSHCMRFEQVKVWRKCALDQDSRTQRWGADIRARWRACDAFVEAPDELAAKRERHG